MKLWEIVKTVGSVALQVALPGTGSLIVGAVNELLPDGKKLPAGATGDDLNNAMASLTREQYASVMEKEFDVNIAHIKESNSTLRAMLESDAKNPQSTRPYIAKGAFHVVSFVVIVTISVWAYGVLIANDNLVKTVMNGWHFVLAVIGPLVTLLWAYFGVLKIEHKNKLDAANGLSTPPGIAGILSKILKK